MAKKLTFKMLKQAKKSDDRITLSVMDPNGKEIEFHVKPSLTILEGSEFVECVAGLVCDVESGEYHPELLDFAMQLFTVLQYSDIELGTDDLPMMEAVLKNTGLYKQIMREIDVDQHDMLVEACYDKVDFLKKMLASAAAKKVSEVMELFQQFMESNNEIAQKMTDGTMGELLQKTSELLSGNQAEANQNIVMFPTQKSDDVE